MVSEEYGRSHELRDGRKVSLRILEPPVADTGDVQFWWRGMKDRWLRGELKDECDDRAFIAYLDGECVGSITLMTPRHAASDVGLVEFVWTREDVRGNGIATFLLKALIESFREQGGLALYLCTINPAADRVYQAVGFRPLVGDGMRYLAPGAEDFDDTYLAHTGPAKVRDARWGDMACFTALYNWPRHACFIKDRSMGVFADYRYESHFNEPMLAHEAGKGLVLALENPEGRVVGACSLREGGTFYEQRTALLDFLVAPAYAEQTAELLQAAVARAADNGWCLLKSERGDGDEDKEDALAEAGFTVAAELPGYFRDERQERSLRIWRLDVPTDASPGRSRGAYYGGLPDFRVTQGA